MGKKVTRYEAIEGLRDYMAEYGRVPRATDLQNRVGDPPRPSTCPSYDTVVRACGSWKQALEAAFTPGELAAGGTIDASAPAKQPVAPSKPEAGPPGPLGRAGAENGSEPSVSHTGVRSEVRVLTVVEGLAARRYPSGEGYGMEPVTVRNPGAPFDCGFELTFEEDGFIVAVPWELIEAVLVYRKALAAS